MTDKILTPFDDLQFGPIADGSPVQVSLLWGNPQTGSAAVMVKFPEGYREPWHSHTATYHAVVVKGSFRSLSPEGGPQSEQVLGPGATMIQPGGVTHAEMNAGAGDALAMVYFDGPIDFVMAE